VPGAPSETARPAYDARMRLHAMHDARTLAAIARLAAPPLCEWMATPLASPGQPLGCFAHGNLLRHDFAFDAELPGDWIFAWSGSLATEMTEVSPMNWMRGPDMLDAACASLGPQLVRHGRRLLLVPHARHVLSDARSALTWWCTHVIPGQELRPDTRAPAGDRAFGLAFDPLAMLEPSMLADASDHLHALFASIGVRADAVILRGWKPVAEAAAASATVPAADAAVPAMTTCAWDDSAVSLADLRALIAQFVDPAVPVLIPGQAVAQAKQALGVG
jgi:hypothetical protein